MNNVIKATLGSLMLAGFLANAAAPAFAGEVQNRLHNQQARIHQGVRSGELTRGEAARDERHLNAIRRERNRDVRRNGGYLTGYQARKINRQLNHDSTRIYRTKHNGNVR